MNETAKDILMHYGVGKLDGSPGRGSGRYPLGSGKDPYQRSMDFLGRVAKMEQDGYSEKEIAEALGFKSTTDFRTEKRIATHERDEAELKKILDLKAQGLTPTEIGRQLGMGESSVRSKLVKAEHGNTLAAKNTADFLKKQLDEKGMIDVSAGTELSLNVSKEKLNEALYLMERDGYKVQEIFVPQATNKDQWTRMLVLTKDDVEPKDIYKNLDKVQTVEDYISLDKGQSFVPAFRYPESLDSKRLEVVYAEQGGVDKDGLIELRRGVEDISLGESNYAQVRILVDGTHYLKGMAVYSDDLPPGVDVRFNTNKHEGTDILGPDSKHSVLKPIENDPDNPFGSLIKEHGGQRYYPDPNGKYTDPITGEKVSLSLINKRADEGDWGEWSKKLPSQFLAKQSEALITKQLKLAEADKKAEYDEIMSYTNPTVRKKLLKDFADSCDADAVYLKAAALPRQRYQVILPVKDIRENEIFAPNYKDGEQVALVRFPHAGQFEIPILRVNNKNKEASASITKNAKDAVGINKKVADQLSGADFDGDTVLVIPVNSKVKIQSQRPLAQLEGFDPKESYPEEKGMTYMKIGKKDKTQREMGTISNLITDMTLKGASPDELARAVKHSMVVIDAGKHKLNYKKSEIDNDIAGLKAKYQTKVDANGDIHIGGASTLLSKAKSPVYVPKPIGSPKIDPETGEVRYSKVSDHKIMKTSQMAIAKDAYDLSEGYRKENLYADYANSMKALANTARKSYMSTKDISYSPAAKETYRHEVATINGKLKTALANQPKERAAQRIANHEVSVKVQAYSDLTKAEKKKIAQQALTKAREQTGASRRDAAIHLTPKEWEAIQNGAITKTRLEEVLKYAPADEIRSYALPRTTTALSPAKTSKANAMKASGYTNQEIAEALGVSVSTINRIGKKE